MEKEILSIKEKINRMGYSYNDIAPNTLKWLERIEQIIKMKDSLYAQGVDFIKSSKYDLKSIAEALGCSRTTLYNHNILKDYINFSIVLSESMHHPINSEQYVDEIKSLKREIEQLEINSVRQAVSMVEINSLHRKIVSLEKDKEFLSLKINELLSQQNKDSISKKSCKVSNINRKKELRRDELNE